LDSLKQIVASGYDRLTDRYLELVGSMGPAVRQKYLEIIFKNIPAGARVLELGCGSGVPMTRALAKYFRVTGVDISKEQLALAVRNVPGADFFLTDMTRLAFSGEAFEAITAFYSITHVPRNEHFNLLVDIYGFLKPGGLLVATMGAGDLPDSIEPDWLGTPMFFSHFDGGKNEIVSAADEVENEYEKPVCFHWIVARKPGMLCSGEVNYPVN
jgi:ubiquinone/menaquinone biosynthesis C-methylase UbiE